GNKLADRLAQYLANVEESHEDRLRSIKQIRRNTIVSRLKGLGWTDEDITFHSIGRFRDPEEKAWHELVDVPRPLTDRIWINMLPKPTRLLEENRERNNTQNAQKRRIERRQYVDQFLTNMKFNDHPFASILDALGVGVPPPPDLSEAQLPGMSASMEAFMLNMMCDLEIANPFPKTETALEWNCLKDLGETEMTIPEVEARLEERKVRIVEQVSEWRATTENRLVEIFGSGIDTASDDVILTVKGSTESTAHLPPTSRFLLRADTLFKRIKPYSNIGQSVATGDRPPCYYPYFVSAICSAIYENVDRHPARRDQPDTETNLEHFTRDLDTEVAAKDILRDLAMPDAAHIELQIMKNRFVCGRCTDTQPKTWANLVAHYVGVLKFWNIHKDSKSTYLTRHPITFCNVHDLMLADSSEPLARVLDGNIPELPSDASVPYNNSSDLNQPICYLCEGTGRSIFRLCRQDMLAHMQNWHNTIKPVEGIYYGKEGHGGLSDEWHKKWDAFHDARREATLVSSAEV
ncbi:hypothetical protein FRC07_009957, partial [Ceratobasidium sp. 392]